MLGPLPTAGSRLCQGTTTTTTGSSCSSSSSVSPCNPASSLRYAALLPNAFPCPTALRAAAAATAHLAPLAPAPSACRSRHRSASARRQPEALHGRHAFLAQATQEAPAASSFALDQQQGATTAATSTPAPAAAFSKGDVVRCIVEAHAREGCRVLLEDGSQGLVPWEACSKRNLGGARASECLPVGEQILAMVRSEARGSTPMHLSIAALETRPGSLASRTAKPRMFQEAEAWLQEQEQQQEGGASTSSSGSEGGSSCSRASFSAWRGKQQLPRFIQPALHEGSKANRRIGLAGVHELRPGALLRGIVDRPVAEGLLVQLTAQPYTHGIIPCDKITSSGPLKQEALKDRFKHRDEIMVHVRRVRMPEPCHMASKQVVWLSTSDLEGEEGALLRSLPAFNAAARDMHAQQQLTRAAVAIREARDALSEFNRLERQRSAGGALAVGSIVTGEVVRRSGTDLVFVRVDRRKDLPMHISQVTTTRGIQDEVAQLLPIGAKVTAAIINNPLRNGSVSTELSVRMLEAAPGQFMQDPRAYEEHAQALMRVQQQGLAGSGGGAAGSSSAASTSSAAGGSSTASASSAASGQGSSSASSSPSASASSGGSGGPAPSMVPPKVQRVPPPRPLMRLLVQAARTLEARVCLPALVEAAGEGSNGGELGDIAQELGREFLRVAGLLDAAISDAVQGDLPWSPSPPTPLPAPSPVPKDGAAAAAAPAQQAPPQQAQQGLQAPAFTELLLPAEQRARAEEAAAAWRRAGASNRPLLVLALALRLKARALGVALDWQLLLAGEPVSSGGREGGEEGAQGGEGSEDSGGDGGGGGGAASSGSGSSGALGAPTPRAARELLQPTRAAAAADALALGVAHQELPGPTLLAHLLAAAADAVALLQPAPPALAAVAAAAAEAAAVGPAGRTGAGGGGSAGAMPAAGAATRRPPLFSRDPPAQPLGSSSGGSGGGGRRVGRVEAAAAAAAGLGLAAEARNAWLGPAVPLLMDWAVGAKCSGAEVVASGLVPQGLVRAGMLGALRTMPPLGGSQGAAPTSSGSSMGAEGSAAAEEEAAAAAAAAAPELAHAFYERLFSKIGKSMVPGRKLAHAARKARAQQAQQQLEERQQVCRLPPLEQQRRQLELQQQAMSRPTLPSPPPPIEGALALLWMAESVGTWRPSHEWWDMFLQRYAAVLPDHLALFPEAPGSSRLSSSSGSSSGSSSSGSAGESQGLVEEGGGRGEQGAGSSSSCSSSGAEGGLAEGEEGSEVGEGEGDSGADAGEGSEDYEEAEEEEEGEEEGEDPGSVWLAAYEGDVDVRGGWADTWELAEARSTAARLSGAVL